MAGALRGDGANDVVGLRDGGGNPVGSTSNAGGSLYVWWLKGTLRAAPTGLCGLLGSSNASTSNGFVTNATLQLRVYTAGTNRYGTGDNFFEVGVYHHYRLEHDAAAGDWRAYRDNMVTPIASGNFTTSTSFSRLDQMFRSSNSSAMYAAFDLEEMGIESTSFTETYIAALSGGTGNVLPTSSGNNQGLLINFPTDNSQWVGFGGSAQSITVNNAQVLQQAQPVSITSSQVIAAVNAQVSQQAQLLAITVSQVVVGTNAQTRQQAIESAVSLSQLVQVSTAQTEVQAVQVTITQSGATPPQDVTAVQAQQLVQANPVSVTVAQNITGNDAQTLQQAETATISALMQIGVTNAQQATQAVQVTVTQGGVTPPQDVTAITAQQLAQAVSVTVGVNQGVVATAAQTITESVSVTCTINQGVVSIDAQTVEAGNVAAVQQMQQIAVLIAQQLTQAVRAGDDTTPPINAAKVKVTLVPSRFTISFAN